MFSVRRINTSAHIKFASITNSRSRCISAAAGGAAIAAAIEARDIIRVEATTIPNAAIAMSSVGGEMTTRIRSAAERPLPSLNPRNIDAIAPINAAIGTAAIVIGSDENAR